MQDLGPQEHLLGKWNNINQIMVRCGYVYNPVMGKWFNHTLRTAWSRESLASNFIDETEFEAYAVDQAKDPSLLRSIQEHFKPLMDQAVNEQPTGGRMDN